MKTKTEYTFQHDSGAAPVTVIASSNESALDQLERDDIFKSIHKDDGWLVNLRSWHLVGMKPYRPWISTSVMIAALCALYFGRSKTPNFYVEPNEKQHIWRVYNNDTLLEAFPSLEEAEDYKDQCEKDEEARAREEAANYYQGG